jgi:hypothetical protein
MILPFARKACVNPALPLDQERPGDFHAHFLRRAKPLAARGRAKHRGRRLVALAVAIAVPAFAAPQGWQGLDAADAFAPVETPQPMGFERPGDSFPGSAFYYLADTPTADRDLAPAAHWDNDDRVGPAARPLVAHGSALDTARALQCMTQAIYYEAASESDAGQRAVAQVVMNRVAHPTYPATVCGVVYQGSARTTGCQFSFTCDGSLARKPSRFAWDRARQIAQQALDGAVYAPVGLATHYHTIAVNPYWAASLDWIGTIGAHRFYRWKGAAGQPAAFRTAYRGSEPLAVRQAGSAADSPDALDPAALARAYEQALAEARTAARLGANPAPAYAAEISARGGESLYAGENLPGSGSVRPEFANSGKWIAQPH